MAEKTIARIAREAKTESLELKIDPKVAKEVKTAVREIVPTVAEAWKSYTKDHVDDKDVAGIVFDLFLGMHRNAMEVPVIDASDALLCKFEEEVEKWFDAEGGPGKQYTDDIKATDNEAEKRQLSEEKEKLLDAYLAPVRTRRLQLHSLKSAVDIRRAESSSYRPPRHFKSTVEVMATLKWFKGNKPQLGWDGFYDFLHGYVRRKDDGKRVHVKGGSVFGGVGDVGDPGGLLVDLDSEFQQEHGQLVEDWRSLSQGINDFHRKNDWERPTGYEDLGDKLDKLYRDMQRERKRLEEHLPERRGLDRLETMVQKFRKDFEDSVSRLRTLLEQRIETRAGETVEEYGNQARAAYDEQVRQAVEESRKRQQDFSREFESRCDEIVADMKEQFVESEEKVREAILKLVSKGLSGKSPRLHRSVSEIHGIEDISATRLEDKKIKQAWQLASAKPKRVGQVCRCSEEEALAMIELAQKFIGV
ncbi:MAG: hypothetical protein ACYTE3_07650 [Planctomycetota bacterium]|jgi:hypothetical protein